MIKNKKKYLGRLGDLFFDGEKFAPISRLRKRFRAGSLLSRILREIMEKRPIRSLIGIQLFAGMILFGPFSGVSSSNPDGLAYPGAGMSDVVLAVSAEPSVETESILMQNPTAGYKGVSKRFQSGHPALDFRAFLGSDVFPVADGTVERIVHSMSGYGRRVIIKHENDFESLYAHMGLIAVEEGDVVTESTKIGEVGMTGWTTGPHIHLEIYHKGVPVNPAYYIDFENIPNS